VKINQDTTSVSRSSTPHRPLTRSQTGTVSKRRKRDDSEEVPATKKRTPPSRKKQKSVSASASGAESASAPPEGRSQSPRPTTTREGSLVSVSSGAGGMGSANATESGQQLTFYHTSPTSEDQAQPECRLPRSRASLPTPIPNLTKKSRGRRVPTQTSAGSADADQKDHRLYVCTVTGCGKCFHRGEHLKRHIRSIHTHEKRMFAPVLFLSMCSHSSCTAFKCTFPLCQKFFNRHDNLLQHLKVHRDVVPTDAEGKSASASAPPSTSAPSPPPRRATASPPTAHRRRARERSYSPADEADSEPVSTTNNSSIPRTIYNAFPMPMPSYHQHLHPAHPLHSHLPIHHEHSLYAPSLHPTMSSYASTSETMSRITNMAVSSLRTELPHPPSVISDMRGGALHTSPY
jgi:hypothetical protein